MPDPFLIPPAPRTTFGETIVYSGLALLMAAALIPVAPVPSFAPEIRSASAPEASSGFCTGDAASHAVCSGLVVQAPSGAPAALLMARMFSP
ncbi:hypothetical protein JSE7799_03864 [Jannaschia seosinensis]|uniref:Uncharacterized protein n=1 Tax=Jannaschia seosinensis TaxID=313367 RepID=A0A0M7BFF3_9RHOB|nr:hypothetical protein [Jannaschia seosinensis]CUH41121.1 hypothetical protein JSE7799_03864 [Jannaschia seosinensis]